MHRAAAWHNLQTKRGHAAVASLTMELVCSSDPQPYQHCAIPPIAFPSVARKRASEGVDADGSDNAWDSDASSCIVSWEQTGCKFGSKRLPQTARVWEQFAATDHKGLGAIRCHRPKGPGSKRLPQRQSNWEQVAAVVSNLGARATTVARSLGARTATVESTLGARG